jgi:hypothetical protein
MARRGWSCGRSSHINLLKEDPAELRLGVDQVARIALRKGIGRDDSELGAGLAQALETAVVGVERFASHCTRFPILCRHQNSAQRSRALTCLESIIWVSVDRPLPVSSQNMVPSDVLCTEQGDRGCCTS